jgi:hypothetical protein
LGSARCDSASQASRDVGRLTGAIERRKDDTEPRLTGKDALVEAIYHAEERRLYHPLNRRRQVLRRRLTVGRAIRQQVDLRVIHLFGKALEEASEEFTERELVGGIAQRVARRRPLPEIVVRGPQAVNGIAQKAHIEEDKPGRLRNRIVNLVAGERLHVGVRFQMRQNIGLLDASIAVGRIEPRKTIAEVAIKNVLNGGARVLQDVIVQNDEAQGRCTPKRD